MSEVIVRMGKLPERCVDCAIRLRCVTYLMALYKTENVYELESLKPEIGSKDCAIVCVLPEQHGRIIDEAVFCENVVKYSHQSTKTIGKALDATPTIIDMTPIVAERSET